MIIFYGAYIVQNKILPHPKQAAIFFAKQMVSGTQHKSL
jgi:hypothetical protein